MSNHRTEPYWTAVSDLSACISSQLAYKNQFINNRLFPESNYLKEIEKVKEKWQASPVTGGCRSLEKDLENLLISFKFICRDEKENRESIELLFKRVYGYFGSMVNDHDRGHLPANRFIEYLNQYQKIISLNKELGFQNWLVEPFELIQSKISELCLN